MTADFPAKTTTISTVQSWPPAYLHASLLIPALTLIEEFPRTFSYPIRTSNPRGSGRAIKTYLGTSRARHGVPSGLSKVAIIDIESLYDEERGAFVRLEASAVQKRKKTVLFSGDICVDERLGGDVQSAFLYVIIPAFRSLTPSLLVGILTLSDGEDRPLLIHTLQWIDAQLNVIAHNFTANRLLSVVLFKDNYPTFLKLDSAAVYAPFNDGITIGFPECEVWARDGKDGWCRRPVCSTKTQESIKLWRMKLACDETSDGSLGATTETPSIGDLFRKVEITTPCSTSKNTKFPQGSAQHRASWELSGGFSPLGGHLMSWVYSPKVPGTSLIVKKTSRTEGAFYNFISQHLWNQDFGLRDALEDLNGAEWGCLDVRNRIGLQLKPLEQFLPRVSDVHLEGSNCYVEMENLLHTDINLYSWRPAHCAMDLKIGTRLWGLDADKRKRERMEYKAKTTTAGTTGLCVIAYRSVEPETGEMIANVSREHTKLILTEEALRTHLKAFFALASLQTIQLVYEHVCRLRDWFKHQTLIHFNSSSLFIIFDARGEAPTVVKLIDFAHASFFHSTIDESSLYGLERLVTYLEELINKLMSACSKNKIL